MAVKPWVWVVAGCAVLVILGFLTLMGAAVYMVVSNVEVAPATAVSAEQQFDDARERFPNSEPLLEVDENGHVTSRPRIPVEASGTNRPAPIKALHILAWDPEEDKLVRVNVPFWVLRLTHRDRIDLGSEEIDFSQLKITLEDLERHGPGLVLDHRDRRGVRVLLWLE